MFVRLFQRSIKGKPLMLLLFVVFQFPVLAQTRTQSSEKKITIQVRNTAIKDIFKNITEQTGLFFMGSNNQLDLSEKISLFVKNKNIEHVLDKILVTRGFTWVIKNNVVTIVKKIDPSENYGVDVNDTLVTIKGSVTTEEDGFLPSATVLIKGTSKGTTTNSNGQFILSNIPDKSIVSISYTGYETQEFRINGAETLIVRLKRTIGSLDETIVIAYGTSSRRYLTGSVGKVKGEDISKQPISNPLAGLQGRVAGLTITQQTGVPGGGFRVSIRGTNSLRNSAGDYQNRTSGNEPLYIIDGIPYFSTPQSMTQVSTSNAIYPFGSGANPLNSINPSDIESVEILKDADATAIYGSRGANGVIIITTKKGGKGKMNVEANFNTGFGRVTRKMDLLNTDQYLEMREEAFKNDGTATYPANAYDINGTWDKNRYTDWQKELIGNTAKNSDGQISVSGGNEYTQYRFGGGFHKETTVFPGEFSFQRFNGSLSLNNTSANGKLKSGIAALYSYNTSDLLSQDLTKRALTLSPNSPSLFDSNGDLNFEDNTFQNPLVYTRQPYRANTYTLITNGNIGYEIINGLILKANFGYTNTSMKQVLKIPISSLNPSLPDAQKINRATFQNGTVTSWNVEPQILYSVNFSSRHKLNFLLGTTFQRETTESLNQSASGFISEELMDNVSAVPASNVTNTFSNSLYSYNALFARINYMYKNKYVVNLNGRRDGSSRFGPGRQFANFGSVGGAWLLSEEPFFKDNINFLTFCKLRASYGITGSDQIPDYGFYDTYTTSGAGQYQNNAGLRPAQLANKDYSWETTKKMDIGLETAILNGKISFSSVYFLNRSSNQLVGYPLPSNTGFQTVQFNLPATVENSGFEFDINSTNIQTKNFRWSTSFNLSIPKNRLVSYPNLEGSSYATSYVVGEPLAIMRVYHYLNVDPQTGLHTTLDVDKNNVYNFSDRIINRFTGQKYFGGISNSISYKNLQLDFLFQFVGQDASNYILNYGMPGEFSNFPVEVMNRWQQPGDVTNIQKFSASKSIIEYYNYVFSDAAISDASFLRLKNLSIIYSMPEAFCNSIGLGSLKVYMTGQNLLTITNYRGLDPETQGVTLPPLTMANFGVKVTL